MSPKLEYKLDGRLIECSHPNKIFYHTCGMVKKDIIEYYLSIASHFLSFSKGRPSSALRFPDGYPGKSFFQRNIPTWAPDWMQSVHLGVEKKADYILINDLPTLVWLVIIEALELHATQVQNPDFNQPDFLVFDIDPPPDMDFTKLKAPVIACKKVIEEFGYQVYLKTSGKRGVHLFCPIIPDHSFDTVFSSAEEIGEVIVNNYKGFTLQLPKENRQNKILIDIYRNHSFQSMILPYSCRATDSATVSMPLTWEEFNQVDSPEQFTVTTVPDILKKGQNAWKDIFQSSRPLHRQQK